MFAIGRDQQIWFVIVEVCHAWIEASPARTMAPCSDIPKKDPP